MRHILILFGLLPVMGAAFSGAAEAAIPSSERAALIRIYEQTGGGGWIDRSGWKEGALDSDGFAASGTEHEWNGVYIEEDHVIALYLGSNNLTGEIPSLAGLPYLKHIDFSYNTLSGPIPSTLTAMTGLEYLGLTGNSLSGRIPEEISGMTSLNYLSLSANILEGPIPSGIGGLVNLTVLYLNHNLLSGSIPVGIGNMTQLEYLSLDNNQLSGNIPPDIGRCSMLVELDLSNNQLTGTIPDSLWTLRNLTGFSVYENMLTGGISNGIGNLTHLDTLYICCNSLEGPLPESLGNLSKLIYLHAYDNKLSGTIPSSLGDLKALKDCLLGNNQFSGSIPSELGGLSLLDTLDLSNNALTGSIPASLGNLTRLTQLYMDQNQIQGSIPSSFGNLVNLEHLSIYMNSLSGPIPPEIGGLRNLKVLKIAENAIEGSIPSTIGDMAALKELSLYRNSLTGPIPSEIGNLSNLEALHVCCNALSGSLPAELGNLSNLKEFHVYDNALTGSIPPEIGNCGNLVELEAHQNALEGEIPAEIGNLTNLTALYLADNQLTGTVPNSFMNLVNLQEGYLNLCGNDLTASGPDLKAFLDSKHGYGWLECQGGGGGGGEDYYVSGSVSNIQHPDGAFWMRAHVCGKFPEPVDSITVASPSGTILFDLNSLELDQESGCYKKERQGEPKPGEYTFTVSGAGAQLTGSVTYEQGRMPVPGAAGLTPSEGAQIDPDAPEFSWPAVDYAQTAYYRIEIVDQNNRPVYTSEVMEGGLSQKIDALEPNKPYSWRLLVADTHDFDTAPHQSASEWTHFTTGRSAQIPIPKPTVTNPAYNAVIEGGVVTLSVAGYPNQEPGLKVIWKIRRSDRGYKCPDCDYKPVIDEITESLSLDIGNTLKPNMKYVWKARYVYNADDDSEWSSESAFIYGGLVNDGHGLVAGGTETVNFEMIAPVCWPRDPYGNSVFGRSISDYENNFRIGTFNADQNYYDIFGYGDFYVRPGTSVWFLSKDDYNVTFNGVRVSTDVDMEIDLKQGWNMIACPNLANYDWASLRIIKYTDELKTDILQGGPGDPIFMGDPDASGYIAEARFWEWDQGAYVPFTSGVLYARKGYWANATSDHLSLRFSRGARAARDPAGLKSNVRSGRRSAEGGEEPPPPLENLNSDLKDDIGGCFLNSSMAGGFNP